MRHVNAPRFAALCLAVVTLAGCASSAPAELDAAGAGTDIQEDEFREVAAVGPLADFDDESLEELGEGLCSDVRRSGTGAVGDARSFLLEHGAEAEEATQSVAALLIRYCPEVAGELASDLD